MKGQGGGVTSYDNLPLSRSFKTTHFMKTDDKTSLSFKLKRSFFTYAPRAVREGWVKRVGTMGD
eukprot:749465-Hanusia_phi.AAC.2